MLKDVALPDSTVRFMDEITREYRLTVQDQHNLLMIAQDLTAWGEPPLEELWTPPPEATTGKNRKQWSMKQLERRWLELRKSQPDYSDSIPETVQPTSPPRFEEIPSDDPSTLLGSCPVSSNRTRCCGLMTLDAVIHCGFDCSYCTIQSFYKDNTIRFHNNLGEKLKRLKLDPGQLYHIGTGQSSDSLMWGDRNGLLSDLFDFAWRNQNVILEFKSKSSRIDHFLKHKIPPNVVVTWSINTPSVISHEERGTATLEERLRAAELVASEGGLVGFHFHPMIPHVDWQRDYGRTASTIIGRFMPEQVTHISFGTLTFIKPVIRAIRNRGIKSRVLQMPMEEWAGKFSYSREVKEELFKSGYAAFKQWHGSVFFYLCMEDPSLWPVAFQWEYPSNCSLEEAMKMAILKKIRRIQC